MTMESTTTSMESLQWRRELRDPTTHHLWLHDDLTHSRFSLNYSSSSLCRPLPICYTFRAVKSSTNYVIRATGTGYGGYKSVIDLGPSTISVDRCDQILNVGSKGVPLPELLSDPQGESRANAMCWPYKVGVCRCFYVGELNWDPFSGA